MIEGAGGVDVPKALFYVIGNSDFGGTKINIRSSDVC